MRKHVILFALFVSIILFSIMGNNVIASTATISTDKLDYAPGSTVTISGIAFSANSAITVSIQKPDLTTATVYATADSIGSFVCTYVLASDLTAVGTYYVSATDGSQTAYAIFTDAAANLDQAQNGGSPGGGGAVITPIDPVEWINGNLGSTKSHYVEGNSIPYRCIMTALPAGTPITINFRYRILDGGKHAIDFLTSYDRLDSPYTHMEVFGHAPEDVFPTDGTSFDGDDIPDDQFTIPTPGLTDIDDPSVPGQPTAEFNALPLAEKQMSIWGGIITAMAYVSEGDLSDTGNQYTTISVTFTPSGTEALLAWGGHIAEASIWGAGQSATGINGSPYHMILDSWTAGNLGQQDRSLSTDAVYVPPAHVTVVKDAVPNDPEDFHYTGTLAAAFDLDDDADATLSNSQTFTIPPEDAGSYTVIEGAETWWTLASITITGDTDGGSTYDLATKTATLDVDPGEDITVTFVNNGFGKVTIVKDAVPNDAEDFSFTTTNGLAAAFDLDDDADATLSNTKVITNVAPGSYNIVEGAESWWTLASITVVGDAGSSVDVPTKTASISVNPGEDITVTFVNNGFGKVTIVKDAQPDDAQDFVFSGDLGAFTLDDDGGADATYINNKVFNTVYYGQYDIIEGTLPPGWELLSISITGDNDFTSGVVSTRTGTIYVDPGEEIVITFTNEKQLEFLKQFTGSGALNGFTPPTGPFPGITSTINQIKTGPQIWWQVTYSVTNEDGEGHFYTLWDKWGGNLMILGGYPTAYTAGNGKNAGILTTSDGGSFQINKNGYATYLSVKGDISGNINYALDHLISASDGAWISLHTGDQQEGTNPGKGNKNTNDGNSYDADVRWNIGWLEPGETATLVVYLAPGINPGGVLQFSSFGTYVVNTGPRVRAYETDDYLDDEFLYSWTWTNQLTIIAEPPAAIASISIPSAIVAALISFAYFPSKRRDIAKRKINKALARAKTLTRR